MKSLWIKLILVAAFLVAGSHTSFAQSPEQLYQKGLMKEEGEGALPDAIELYSQIADNSEADQSLRAKALLHIGLCYERMGTQEAVNAYQRLVNNYPSQKYEVAIAKERLNSLIVADKPAQKVVKEDLIIRKVLPDTEIEPLGAPSPNGRFVSFVDWSSGSNLCILDLETKEKRYLTDFKDKNDQAYYSRWSNDGKQIAYFWWRYDKDQYNLSVVNVKSAESRDLFISDKYDWIELGNWSSEDKYIFATLYLRDELKSQIVRVSAAEGAIEVLKTFEEPYTGGKPYVSPDNRFVAFDLQGMDASGNNDIILLSLENGTVNTLIEHPSHDYILGWSPDGNSMLFATDRTGTVDAMLIAVKEGKPTGRLKSVKQNIGPIVPMGFTEDGSFFFGQWPGADNIYSAEIDIHTGRILSEPFLMIQKFAGRNYSPAYSSDGKYLAYISDRGVLNKGEPGPVLCIRNLETLEENEIIADPDVWGGLSNPQWSPDDHAIVLACDNKENLSRIYKYDVLTKDFSLLVQEAQDQSAENHHAYPIHYAYPIWSMDGKSLFYLQFSRYTTSSRLMAYDIASGSETELYSYSSDDLMDRLFNISLSPDGKWLAAINRGEHRVVRLISTEGKEIKNLYSFNSSGGFPYSPIWSKDGTYIVFPYQDLKSSDFYSREWGLMRIPSKGGEILPINLDIHGVASPTLHPDGHTLSFRSAGTSFPENNIWEMKNFLRLGNVSDEELAEEPLNPIFTKIKIPTELSWSVRLSPDGKNLAFVSDKKLWMMPLASNLGSNISGAPVEINTEGIKVEWSGLSWSKDGRWIAFNEVPPQNDSLMIQGIYIVPSTGGPPKKVSQSYRDARIVNYKLGLSPDGDKLVYSAIEESKQHIFLSQVDGGEAYQLVDMQAREPVVSPDGSMIAFAEDRGIGRGAGNLGLWTVSVKGGVPKLVAEAGKATSPVWSPDGKMIAYLDNTREQEIFIVEIDESGQATGNPTSIDLPEDTKRVHLLAGWTPDHKIGSLLLRGAEAALFTLPANGGQAALVLSNTEAFQPRWSADGKQIIYTSLSKDVDNTFTWGSLASVPVNGGTGSDLPVDDSEDTVKLFYYQGGNQISPDGNTIVAGAWTSGDISNEYFYPKGRIWKYSLDDNRYTQITRTEGPYLEASPCWSPDGKQIAFVRIQLLEGGTNNSMGDAEIFIMDSSGEYVEFLESNPGKNIYSLEWSPDGEKIAYFSQEKQAPYTSYLNVVHAQNGKSRVIQKLPGLGFTSELAWSPGSRKIAYNDSAGSSQIKVISLSDGKIETIKTGLKNVKIYNLDWSPDGTKFVFAGRKDGEIEFWFMENFLPLEKLPQDPDIRLAEEPEGIRIRQVRKMPYLDYLGSVSSDGRLLSYIHWGEGDVAVHNLVTGEDQVLLHEADLDTMPQRFAQCPKISRDGSQIAYYMWNPYHTSDLRLTDVINPAPRTIYMEEGIEVYPADWLSDQELITCRQNRNTENTAISIFNVSDGTYRDLKEFEGRTWGNIAASPDEKYIAHDFNARKYEGNRDIKLFHVDGSGEISLISHPANDRVLGWDPDNNVLLFTSDRSGEWDLWGLPISDGKPNGPEQRLYSGIGEVEPVGFTESGDCYYGFSKRYFNTSLAPFNSSTGEIQEESAASLEGSNFWLTWSPDGQYLAYINEDRNRDASWQLTIKDLKSGEEKGLGKNLHPGSPAWSPDGNSILFIGRDDKNTHRQGYIGDIYLANIHTGRTEKILSLSDYKFKRPDDDSPPLSALTWSPDGQGFYMLFYKDRIIKHDLRSGKDEVIIKHSNFEPYILQCSTDGSTLLFGTQNKGEKSRLYTIPAGGGDMVELCSAQEANDFVSANWSPDGKYLYFSESPEGTNLWRLPAKGGKAQKVWHSENRTSIYNIHPDGKQIAYSQRVRTTEVRVIENLSSEIARVFNKIE